MGVGWVLAVAATLAGAGWAAGSGARVLLARLRRGATVSAPRCEVAVAVLWALTTGWFGVTGFRVGWLPVLLGLGWLAVALSATDVANRRLPDALTVPALPVALALLVPLGAETVLRAAAGAATLAGAHAVVHLAAPRAMGAGDVKLAAPLGAVLAGCSWTALLLAPLLAMAGTALVGVVGLLTRRVRRRDPLPHGPALLAAAWLLTMIAAARPGG